GPSGDAQTSSPCPLTAASVGEGQIHCASCENTIRTALSRPPGVGMVVPSAERNDVKVSFDDTQVAEDQLRAALADVGFEPVA
ncbi:MAG TPA: heavy-metal-associated domain-containing protein, partial [Acidimicrobiia bacterium]|nr:heavy-metal-associated domain-containing protein [Acidimicrobiia bacterium]